MSTAMFWLGPCDPRLWVVRTGLGPSVGLSCASLGALVGVRPPRSENAPERPAELRLLPPEPVPADTGLGLPVGYRLEGTIGVDAGRLGQPTFGPLTLLEGDVRVRR